MNAIDLLEKQHREVEELFEEFEGAGDGARKTKERVCAQIADRLAIHTEIEEKIFYPEAKQEKTEGKELFPKVRKACSKAELADMGDRMQRMVEDLELEGQPSRNIPGQTDEPAPI